jgi:glycosyltransferase involved in cell wall biosynthesis
MKPLRLLHLTTTDMSLALLLCPQLIAFREAGYEVFGASAPGEFVADLERAGIRHIPLKHATRAMDPTRDVIALAELRAALKAIRPNIVHTHNPKPGVYGRLTARLSGVPVVVNTVHGLYAQPSDSWRRRGVVYGLERLASTCSDTELVQNPEDLDTLASIGVPRAKLRLLGNGVDLTRFRPGRLSRERRDALRAEMGAGPGEVVCGAIGRMVWEKGYAELFAAAGALRSRHPEVRMVVIGPDDEAKADRIDASAITEAERSGGVRFLGYRADVEDLYEAFDLYVLASHREGFPRSAMEAAATGLPVVATDIRGCRQVVENGVTGALVPVGGAAALADAIAGLAASPTGRQAMGKAARAKAVAEFDQQQVIDITLETYRRLLNRAGG